jgi:hypothetical protein
MRKTDKRTEENIKKLKLFLKNGIDFKLHDQKGATHSKRRTFK